MVVIAPDVPQLPQQQIIAPAPNLKESRSKQRTKMETLQAIEGMDKQADTRDIKRQPQRQPFPEDLEERLAAAEEEFQSIGAVTRGRWIDILV